MTKWSRAPRQLSGGQLVEPWISRGTGWKAMQYTGPFPNRGRHYIHEIWYQNDKFATF